jgi:hypothetical protein
VDPQRCTPNPAVGAVLAGVHLRGSTNGSPFGFRRVAEKRDEVVLIKDLPREDHAAR